MGILSGSSLSHIVIGFEGTSLPQEVRELLERGLGGIVLFSRNLEDLQQVQELTQEILRLGGEDVLIAVDQEGGPVQRLKGIGSTIPAAEKVGRIGAQAATVVGTVIGRELAALGFNMDLAPVLDVRRRDADPVIGERAFSEDPMECASAGAKFIVALQGEGVAACAKHFPGHGAAKADSHKELPVIKDDFLVISKKDLLPFRSAVGVGVQTVMTAHCLYESIDPQWPGSLSSNVVNGLLRRGIGFKGVVITDDLEMKAVSAEYGLEEVVIQAVQAGSDLLMFCSEPQLGIEAAQVIDRMAQERRDFHQRLQESSERLGRLAQWLKKRAPVREKWRGEDFERLRDTHKEMLDALLV